MKILETMKHEQAGEEVTFARSQSGVDIAVCRTPGFASASGYFGLRFGSTDMRFRMPSGETIDVPSGSAHYLEHKLFEGREEKVFDRFGRLGAEFNGGTSFRTTNYHFTTTDRFLDCLEVLVDFVQHPLITEDRVEKERGIIEQEVRMYGDHPGFHGTFLLHEALYAHHGIRIEPGGSVEDVRRISAQDLQSCFDGFYRPRAMRLALAGDFEAQPVLDRLEELLDAPDGPLAEKMYPQEPGHPAEERLEKTFAVTRPHVWIGWRDPQGLADGRARLRQRILSSLVLDLVFDASSQTHERLYREGVIDDSFNAYWSSDEDWGHVVLSGVTDDPEDFITKVRKAAADCIADGLREEDYERLKRAAWGGLVSGLQTPSALAGSILNSMLERVRPFATLDLLGDISFEEVVERAEELFLPKRSAVAMLLPQE